MLNEQDFNPEVFFKYISRQGPDEKSMRLYKEALKMHALPLGKKEEKLFRLSVKYPFLIPFFDGGLALIEPHSPYRQRLYIVLIILETRPGFFSLLSSSSDMNSPKISFFKAFWVGARSAIRGIIGIILVKLL